MGRRVGEKERESGRKRREKGSSTEVEALSADSDEDEDDNEAALLERVREMKALRLLKLFNLPSELSQLCDRELRGICTLSDAIDN